MTDPVMTVYFDYVCPYCLLAADAVRSVSKESGAGRLAPVRAASGAESHAAA